MFSFLFNCLANFGLRGLIVYLKIKFNLTERISLPGLAYPLSFRPTRVDNITFREIFIRREYDIAFPPSFSPETIIDAGANIGFTSVFFANKFPAARILSLEPDLGNFNVLKRNLDPYHKITPIRSAIWRADELIHLVDEGYGERGFIVQSKGEGPSMPGRSIDSLLKEFDFKTIDILKMDIEGSEKVIFETNYDEWLRVTKCLIIELHDRMVPGCSKAVFTAINKHNFSMEVRGDNLIFYNQDFPW